MKVFHPNCTLPLEGPVFVAAPPLRGTLSILWSSLVLLLLSTWEVQHPNVPFPVSGGFWKRRWSSFVKRFGWTLFYLLYPEFIPAKAVCELETNRAILRKLKASRVKCPVPWTLTHVYYANMGGFAVVFPDEGSKNEDNPKVEPWKSGSRVRELTPLTPPALADPAAEALDVESGRLTRSMDDGLTDSHSSADNTSLFRPSQTNSALTKSADPTGKDSKAGQSGVEFIAETTLGCNVAALCTNTWILTTQQLQYACESGIIDKMPAVRLEEIEDQSKSTALGKVIVMGQFVWLFIQICARHGSHLVITQLELIVFGYGLCTIISYLTYWKKPQNVEAFRVVKASRFGTLEEVKRIASLGPHDLLCVSNRDHPTIPESYIVMQVDDETISSGLAKSCDTIWAHLTFVVTSILFSVLHFLAHRFNFPSAIEQKLWLAAAIIFVSWPGLFLFQMCPEYIFGFMMILCTTAVTLARLYALVEMFRALAFSPASAYQSTWSINIPHIG